jgi:hypothetical protein
MYSATVEDTFKKGAPGERQRGAPDQRDATRRTSRHQSGRKFYLLTASHSALNSSGPKCSCYNNTSTSVTSDVVTRRPDAVTQQDLPVSGSSDICRRIRDGNVSLAATQVCVNLK